MGKRGEGMSDSLSPHYLIAAPVGVEGIVLLFSANDGSGPVYKFPAYDYFAPVLEPLLEEVGD